MLQPSRILIVEDEEILAANLKIFFGRRTPDVRVVSDAWAAMEMLKSFAPDLVVLDYALPGIDGLRVHRAIVGASAQAPSCVMMTGYRTDLLVESARRQGIRHVLCKPFSFAELQQAVDSSIGEAGAASGPGSCRVDERRSQRIFWLPADRRYQPARRPSVGTQPVSR